MKDGLFKGTAEYYERFRVPYPAEVFRYIVAEHRLDGRGRLLDCGCGTGRVCIPLSAWFEDTIAIDPEAEMLAVAARLAGQQQARNIAFHRMTAEELSTSLAPVRMATFGASFHWTDRVSVATRLHELIEPGGAIVILGPSGLWTGPQPWKAVVRETIRIWLGEDRYKAGGSYLAGHQECLKQTPFCALTEWSVRRCHTWMLDAVIGYLLSTSLTSRAALGENAEGFERDLRDRLVRHAPCGRFPDEIEYTVISAKRL
jgi:trans-aconitate methyltransferase